MNTNVNTVKNTGANAQECYIVPPVDIIEDKEAYRLVADMPGISKDQLDISIDNRELSITGKPDISGDNATYSEYALGTYKRKFVLNEEIDSTGISATVDKGILTLVLPKRESVKPRKIEVKTA